jgi:hypothetical protein
MRSYHKLSLFAAVGALFLGAALASGGGTAAGPPAPIDPEGRPKKFHEGQVTGYAVWHHHKEGWRFRTTTKKREHHFRGSITVEGGTITHAHSYHLEKTGKLQDHWQLGPKRHTIHFDFRTDRGLDGINFRVSKDAVAIRFNLHIDGKHERHHIFIGHASAHPQQDPFLLVAHPARK